MPLNTYIKVKEINNFILAALLIPLAVHLSISTQFLLNSKCIIYISIRRLKIGLNKCVKFWVWTLIDDCAYRSVYIKCSIN